MMRPNNLEQRLSIWYSETLIKPNTDYPRLKGTYE